MFVHGMRYLSLRFLSPPEYSGRELFYYLKITFKNQFEMFLGKTSPRQHVISSVPAPLCDISFIKFWFTLCLFL